MGIITIHLRARARETLMAVGFHDFPQILTLAYLLEPTVQYIVYHISIHCIWFGIDVLFLTNFLLFNDTGHFPALDDLGIGNWRSWCLITMVFYSGFAFKLLGVLRDGRVHVEVSELFIETVSVDFVALASDLVSCVFALHLNKFSNNVLRKMNYIYHILKI